MTMASLMTLQRLFAKISATHKDPLGGHLTIKLTLTCTTGLFRIVTKLGLMAWTAILPFGAAVVGQQITIAFMEKTSSYHAV